MESNEKLFKNFIILWLGQLISILGSGLTTFGIAAYVYSITGKATPLALTVLFATIPQIVLSPIAGLWADRYNKKWVMLISDSGAAFSSLILYILLQSGHILIWNIYIITLINAAFNVFKSPALQSSIVLLVPSKNLETANGMNQVTDAIQNLAAPLISGILYLLIGLRFIILIDFITFFAAIGTLIYIPSSSLVVNHQKIYGSEDTKQDKKENNFSLFINEAFQGFRFIIERKGLMAMMIYFAFVNFFLNLSIVLLTPLTLSFSNSAALGAIQMAGGIGMLVGSLCVTFLKNKNGLINRIFLAIMFAAINLIVMGGRDSIFLISIGRFLFLFSIPLANNSAFVIWQMKGPINLQGRLFAARQMLARSIMPLAYLIAGPLADIIIKPLVTTNNNFLHIINFLVGNGPGVVFRVIFIFSGLILLFITIIFINYKPLRNLESELPNY